MRYRQGDRAVSKGGNTNVYGAYQGRVESIRGPAELATRLLWVIADPAPIFLED